MEYRFFRTTMPVNPQSDEERSLDDDPEIALLAISVARQQSAGFRDVIDIRKFRCPECGEAGFNSGLGFVGFVCGAEVVGDEFDKPCSKTIAA